MHFEEFFSHTIVMVSWMLSYKEEVRTREFDIPPARLSSIIANCHRDPEKKPEPFTAADFLPGLADKDRLVLTPEELRAQEAEALLAKSKLLFTNVPHRERAVN